jgi:Cu-Zn family superoxide dismutase
MKTVEHGSHSLRFAAVVTVVAALTACSHKGSKADAQSAPAVKYTSAQATLLGASTHPKINGEFQFTPTAQGVRLQGVIRGLKGRSTHGFHIHEKGDCSAPDFTSAGPHFNPDNKAHGAPMSGNHHAGDLGNIRSDKNGVATIDVELVGISLVDAPFNIVDRSLVLHAKPDDLRSQPAGESGPRIACGVIQGR